MRYKEYLKKAQKRRERAFIMWLTGDTYSKIGRVLGVSRQRARAMVKTEDRRP